MTKDLRGLKTDGIDWPTAELAQPCGDAPAVDQRPGLQSHAAEDLEDPELFASLNDYKGDPRAHERD